MPSLYTRGYNPRLTEEGLPGNSHSTMTGTDSRSQSARRFNARFDTHLRERDRRGVLIGFVGGAFRWCLQTAAIYASTSSTGLTRCRARLVGTHGRRRGWRDAGALMVRWEPLAAGSEYPARRGGVSSARHDAAHPTASCEVHRWRV